MNATSQLSHRYFGSEKDFQACFYYKTIKCHTRHSTKSTQMKKYQKFSKDICIELLLYDKSNFAQGVAKETYQFSKAFQKNTVLLPHLESLPARVDFDKFSWPKPDKLEIRDQVKRLVYFRLNGQNQGLPSVCEFSAFRHVAQSVAELVICIKKIRNVVIFYQIW